jgi:hypothetical protein
MSGLRIVLQRFVRWRQRRAFARLSPDWQRLIAALGYGPPNVQFRGGGTPCPETAGSVSPGTADKIEAGACRVSGHGVCREATNPARNRASSSPVGSRALDTQNAGRTCDAPKETP